MKITFIFLLMLSLLAACKQTAPESLAQSAALAATAEANNSALVDAFKHKKSDIFVQGSGVVKKLLADDNKGARHQKFLVTISPNQTLLFAHNIDLAPRLDDLKVGDTVSFRGEYVYNPKGGVMHWTHHDPQGEKLGGWLKHNGKTYD